jgi:hypothetical protein
MTVKLSMHREVAGVIVPFRLVSEANGVVFEDLRLDRVEINPILSDAQFHKAEARP